MTKHSQLSLAETGRNLFCRAAVAWHNGRGSRRRGRGGRRPEEKGRYCIGITFDPKEQEENPSANLAITDGSGPANQVMLRPATQPRSSYPANWAPSLVVGCTALLASPSLTGPLGPPASAGQVAAAAAVCGGARRQAAVLCGDQVQAGALCGGKGGHACWHSGDAGGASGHDSTHQVGGGRQGALGIRGISLSCSISMIYSDGQAMSAWGPAGAAAGARGGGVGGV
jgi:hypothetical protein